MTVKAQLLSEDYAAFVNYVARSTATPSSDKVVRRLIFVAVGLGVGFFLSLRRVAFDLSGLGFLICGFFGGSFALAVALSFISKKHAQRIVPADDGYILGLQETTLGHDCVGHKSTFHEAAFNWALVRAVVSTEKHIFIMLDRIAGIIIPKRAFHSQDECHAFIKELEKLSGKTAI